MPTKPIRSVAVVGTGVIGASWAALFLARGLDVRATDPSPGAEDRLRATIAQHWPALERLGLSPGARQDRLTFDADLEAAVEGAYFVQENGPERIDIKIDIFRRLDAVLPPETILASSSSGLPMSEIQSSCRHPERVVLGHPFNPAHLIPLVEVVGGASTSDAAVADAVAFYAAIGKRPIRLRKEIKGHVADRLQAALWREAFHLVDQGAATVADIDAAIAHGPGLRWALLGPFLNLHLSGGEGGIAHVLEHLGPAIESWWDDLGTPRMTPELVAKVVQGTEETLGKSGAAELGSARDKAVLEFLEIKKNAGLPE
ncbi:3-hydroxyacyl-CoA dehydrogenase NAD-binding domain-containing protein [Halomonas sp. G15]|uniref:3-hydroxyacyl-CoA dehydrogenase NAD-binding domain-containing protein n=1 Tax=Halomonas sp. G15 TaxID=2903521 RepID=UPI001E60B4F2|nr:3-hydroxyacyl-CoA dehydrogenase NAD-binding domain-containing protein [Halomonas sp. G15]MCE0732437.1 3-hydroxyacyl-CoA dehydrogenase NAD-binding domain-containing protein [Halomonas sp. G15]